MGPKQQVVRYLREYMNEHNVLGPLINYRLPMSSVRVPYFVLQAITGTEIRLTEAEALEGTQAGGLFEVLAAELRRAQGPRQTFRCFTCDSVLC